MRRIMVVVAGALLAAAACSSTGANPGGQAGTSAQAPTASEPAVVASAVSPENEAPTPTSFKAITLSGSSDKVAKFRKPSASAAIAVVTYRGADNFVIASLDASGNQNDLLVNTIGTYSGTVLFDVNSDSVAFQVTAVGPWKIVIEPLTAARRWSGSGSVTGRGDDVIMLSTATSGLTSATITNRGQDNFIVTSYTTTQSDLLVNEIGAYNGEVPLPDGTVLIAVESTGAWTIRV